MLASAAGVLALELLLLLFGLCEGLVGIVIVVEAET